MHLAKYVLAVGTALLVRATVASADSTAKPSYMMASDSLVAYATSNATSMHEVLHAGNLATSFASLPVYPSLTSPLHDIPNTEPTAFATGSGTGQTTKDGLCGHQHNDKTCFGYPGGRCCSHTGFCGFDWQCEAANCDANHGYCNQSFTGSDTTKYGDVPGYRSGGDGYRGGEGAVISLPKRNTVVTSQVVQVISASDFISTATTTVTVDYASKYSTSSYTTAVATTPKPYSVSSPCNGTNAALYDPDIINISTFSATGLTLHPTINSSTSRVSKSPISQSPVSRSTSIMLVLPPPMTSTTSSSASSEAGMMGYTATTTAHTGSGVGVVATLEVARHIVGAISGIMGCFLLALLV